jgi:hypothetical protein
VQLPKGTFFRFSINGIATGVQTYDLRYFYPKIVLPAVSITIAISAYCLEHEILTAANVLMYFA